MSEKDGLFGTKKKLLVRYTVLLDSQFFLAREECSHYEIVVNLRNKNCFSVFNSFTGCASNKRITRECGSEKKESETKLRISQHTGNLPQPQIS